MLFSWAALAAAALAWFGSQQSGSDFAFAHCIAARWWWIALIGLAAVALALTGGMISWRVRRRVGESEGRRFIALVGISAATLLTLAILLQTLAAFIIPRCAA